MVKTVKLPERPKPPDREEILTDLKKASDDDIIFADLKNQSSPVSPSLSSEESYAELPTLDKSEETASNDGAESSHLQDHINMTYKQVKKLIQLHSQLVNEPKLLQEKYENLKDLGEDVSDSIADLKRAAENIAKKS